jgi:hypothetical protein
METFLVLLLGRLSLQVALGWEDCCGGDRRGPACFYIREGDNPRNRYIRRTKFGRITFPSVILMTLISSFPISFLISVIHNKQTKIHLFPTWRDLSRRFLSLLLTFRRNVIFDFPGPSPPRVHLTHAFLYFFVPLW